MTAKHAIDTPITDRLERSVEAQGNRDVPVRVYQQMRALEDDRARLIEALKHTLALSNPRSDGQRHQYEKAYLLLSKLEEGEQ